ncbi:hypothetical protein TNCV_4846841, partial [Trichonephila clavipes]
FSPNGVVAKRSRAKFIGSMAAVRSNDERLHPSGLSGIFHVSVRILAIKDPQKESLQLAVLLSLSFARILAISKSSLDFSIFSS